MNHLENDDLEYVIDLNPSRTLELTLIQYLNEQDPELADRIKNILNPVTKP
ncbi:MAG: hypothetical protein JNL01_03765 [Bdellovibrionales bacterium]|nr:hypothetical protein [Bdellovibrionales bacterium]